MVHLSLFCFSAFTWSASSGASIVHNINAYTEESPTKSIGEFVWKVSNRIPRPIGKKRGTPKINNGRKALVGEFPWMASIHWNSNERQGHQCGGSIISRRHILTAAHCLPTEPSRDIQMTVFVGGHFQNETSEPRAQRITVKKMVLYAGYTLYPLTHDIAILVLEKEIELSKNKAIINLPSGEDVYVNVNGKAVGWGKTYGDPPFVQNYKGGSTAAAPAPDNSDRYDVSPVLKATNLTIFNNTECNLWYSAAVNYEIKPYTICAGASYLTGDALPGDTTQGDSGGPLVIKEKGKWVVAGITSVTHSTAGHPLPGIYTRVSAYLPWIKVHMNKY